MAPESGGLWQSSSVERQIAMDGSCNRRKRIMTYCKTCIRHRIVYVDTKPRTSTDNLTKKLPTALISLATTIGG